MFLDTFASPSRVSVMSKDVPPMSTVMMFFIPQGSPSHIAACGAEAGPELIA